MKNSNLTRKDFLLKRAVPAVAFCSGLDLLASCGGKNFSTDAGKPNIILITADDLGWKDLSCYGNTNIRTENIDRLASGGIRFEKAFVVSSSCAPSRASLITGQYPHTNGVTGLTHIYKTRSLRPFYRTLPSILRKEGYNTALQGKWHVSPYLPTSLYGYNERLSGMLPKDFHIHDTKKTIDFIKRNKGNRFYLEINYMNNHRDGYGEFSFAEGFPVDPDSITIPGYTTLPNWPEIREDFAKFYSQTLKMDAMVGEILDSLDELGLAENTMVLFISDNGPPYPGNKMTLYDRGARVPLLIRWPEKFDGNRAIPHLTNSIDLMPTILEACGIPIPGGVEGESLFSVLANAGAKPVHEEIFLEMTDHVYHLPTRAVRTENWKYIRNYSDIAMGLDQNNHMEWAHRLCEKENQPWKKPRVQEELYNLEADPNEQNNLAGIDKYREKLGEMKTLLRDHMKATDDPYLNRGFQHDYDPSLYTPSVPGEKYK